MRLSRALRRRAPAERRGLLRLAVSWLAVLAIVAQAVLFEFAMTPRPAAAEPSAASHCHPSPAPQDDRQHPGHQHGKYCPFCIARACHQLASLPIGAGLATLVVDAAVVVVPVPRPDPVRARRRPPRFGSRAPP